MRRKEKNSHEKNVDAVFFDKGLALDMITFLDGTELYTYKLITQAANRLIIQSLQSSKVLKETVKLSIEAKISAKRDHFVQIGEGYVDLYAGDFHLPEVNNLIEEKSNGSGCTTIRKLKSGIYLLTCCATGIAAGSVIIYIGVLPGKATDDKIVFGALGGIFFAAGVIGCGFIVPKMYRLSKVYNSVSSLVGNFHSLLGSRMSTSLTQPLLKDSKEEKEHKRGQDINVEIVDFIFIRIKFTISG